MQSKSEKRAVKEKQKVNSDERVSDERQSKKTTNMEDKKQMRKGCKISDNRA